MPDPQTLPALVRAKYPGQYDDLSDADLDAKVRAKFPGVYDDIPKLSAPAAKTSESPQSESPKYGTGLTIAAAAKGASAALSQGGAAALKLAVSPTAMKIAPETGSMIGQGLAITSGLGTAATQALSGNLVGAGEALMATGPAAWMAGRAGWHTAKLANRVAPAVIDQAKKVALPIALNPATPYLQPALRVIGNLGAAQGVNDLAQMAEPNRRDIGVMGVGPSAPRIDPDALLASQAATLDRLKVPATQKAAALQRTKADLIRLGYYK